MRTRLLLVIIAAVGAVGAFVGISGAFAGSAPRSGVAVKPKKGRPGTKFVVRFVAPDAAGRHGVISTDYVVEASAVSARRGCVSQIVVRVERAAANTSASAKLAPAAGGASGSTPRAASGRWCKGTFHGQVNEIQRPVCMARTMCPLLADRARTIGRFTFRVRPRAQPRR